MDRKNWRVAELSQAILINILTYPVKLSICGKFQAPSELLLWLNIVRNSLNTKCFPDHFVNGISFPPMFTLHAKSTFVNTLELFSCILKKCLLLFPKNNGLYLKVPQYIISLCHELDAVLTLWILQLKCWYQYFCVFYVPYFEFQAYCIYK
jgi:hypothetical protein